MHIYIHFHEFAYILQVKAMLFLWTDLLLKLAKLLYIFSVNHPIIWAMSIDNLMDCRKKKGRGNYIIDAELRFSF